MSTQALPVSGLAPIAQIIPFQAQKEILRFATDGVTGQVVLNFHQGNVANVDSKNHILCSTKCRDCGKKWGLEAEGWTVRNAHAYCGGCGT